MRYIGLFVAASLLANVAAAKSTQFALNESLEIGFDQARSQILGRNSNYNYSAHSRAESIGIIQKFQLSPGVSAGLGFWLGGPEIELETETSIVRFEDIDVDLNRWLGAQARIKFVDIIPFGNIAYQCRSRDQRLRFSANAGIKFLKPFDVSIAFDGEWGDIVAQRTDLVSQLEQDVANKLENYYLEPVLGVDLSYTFD